MTSQTTTAPRTPAEHTHPCARCGAPVALDVGLCEDCNPLGLRDAASSQVHGTVFVAIGVAFVALALAAKLAVSGIGPFTADVAAVRVVDGAVTASLRVTNDGSNPGTSTCKISDAALNGLGKPTFILTPRIPPHESVTFDVRLPDVDPAVGALAIDCSAP